MNRLNLTRLALASTIVAFAFPLASYASVPGPVTIHPTTPSDTLTKLNKTKSERSTTPGPKKKLKGRQTTPAPTLHSEFVPDQPWETEFYVENDISGRHVVQLALASLQPRH